MTEQEMIDWIHKAGYEDILRKWRFEPLDSPWMLGRVGEAIKGKFLSLREKMSDVEKIRASKTVGWNK